MFKLTKPCIKALEKSNSNHEQQNVNDVWLFSLVLAALVLVSHLHIQVYYVKKKEQQQLSVALAK